MSRFSKSLPVPAADPRETLRLFASFPTAPFTAAEAAAAPAAAAMEEEEEEEEAEEEEEEEVEEEVEEEGGAPEEWWPRPLQTPELPPPLDPPRCPPPPRPTRPAPLPWPWNVQSPPTSWSVGPGEAEVAPPSRGSILAGAPPLGWLCVGSASSPCDLACLMLSLISFSDASKCCSPPG